MTRKSTRAEWQRRVEAWKASGLSAREYGRKAGLNAKTLYFWQWKLGAESKEAPSTASSAAAAGEIDSSCFLEVSSVDVGKSEESFEVVLRSGHRVLVPVNFDDGALSRLVATLEVRP